ncbi:MAG: hypothetical protein DI548_16970, partial [Flavobacterium johnsoniae]
KGTTFSNCSMIALDFMNTDLTNILFDHCNLHKTVFSNTTAIKADFTTSYNFSIDPEKNKIKKASFSLAGLKGLLQKHELIIKE